MKYIDIHSHLDFKDFDLSREDIISEMKIKEIGTFNVGTSLKTSLNSIDLASKHDNIWSIVGIHPLYSNESRLEDFDEIEPLIQNPRCVGIGECGLDFFREANDQETKARQLEFFEKQIELSLKYKKPLMIHCRSAYTETLDVLASYKKSHPELHAHFHFFTESIETAKIILDLGFTVSFTGVITFAEQYQDLVRFVPLESVMVETDSPYVAPKSVRGTTNNPLNVIEIANAFADIRKDNREDVAEALLQNTKKVFGL